jgi:glycosyltransferase involved in cell wall biosynthesis
MGRPKVSVSLITYNHEKYIASCLDSVIGQKTSFDLEIIVSDDCSTDGTADIIAGFAARYPQLIKPILRKQNVGMVKNALETINQCTGDYIAILEGDDFWCDENKLQKQADYLNSNPDCAICYTNGYIFYENEPGRKEFFFGSNTPPPKIDLDYYIRQHPVIPNNTKMFRHNIQPGELPQWTYSAINWDWVLHVLHLQNGKAGYLDLVSLAYRRHPGAAFNANSEEKILLSGIAVTKHMDAFLNYRYHQFLKNLSWEYHQLSFVYLRQRRWFKFLVYYWQFIISNSGKQKMHVKDELWRIKTALKANKS